MNFDHLPGMLERFRAILELPPSEWSDFLGVDPEGYTRILRGEEEVSLKAVTNLSERCQVSLEGIMRGAVDFAAVSAHLAGEEHYLPERYSVGAFSKRISSVNLLNYIEQFYGWNVRFMALRRLQVGEGVFRNSDEYINVNFLGDLCAYLSKYYCNEADFISMGTYSAVTYRNSQLGHKLAASRSIGEMYEMMTEECLPKYIERNCTYRLFSLDEKGCVVDVFPNPDVQDALKTKAFGNPHFCATKVGVTASVTAYKNLPFAKVIETKCVHQGSPFCRFEVDYSLPEQAMQKRQRASS